MKQEIPKFIGIQKYDKNLRTRKFVITGCGRSGTLFMTKVFEILGFEIGHEGILKNGTSSWYLTERSHSMYIKRLFKNHNTTFIHIVRHPLHVISSMYLCEHLKNRLALDFVRKYYPEWKLNNGLQSVVVWWIFWNMETASKFNIDVTLPIEQLQYPDAFCTFCRSIGIKYKPKYFQRVKELGDKTHTIRGMFKHSLKKTYGEDILKPITFKDIKKENKTLAQTLKDFAKNYGYKL